MVSLESTVRIGKDVFFREVDGEAVILNLQTGVYFGLDPVGTRMWTLLEEHGNVETVYKILLEEYNVDEDTLRKDLLDLIGKLESKGLVERSNVQETATDNSTHVIQ